jgi:N-hydroxyarylamine O-acetyltransferase
MNRDANLWCRNAPRPMQLADRLALREFVVTYFGFDLPEIEQMKVPTIPEWH